MSGRVVVVTGASSGVGRATARAFAARGESVGLIARGHDGLEGARRDVTDRGARALACVADVADADAVEAAAARIEAELGPIDVWVNVAMTAVLAELWDCTPEEFARVTQVTYLGSVHGMQAALKRFRPRNRGVIVQVGSALSRRGIPLQSTYCGSKHAVKGVLDSLRAELLHEGSDVQVALVQLPGVNTPQFDWVRTRLHRHPQPVPPIYQPEVAARAIVFAAQHPRRELWVGFPTVYTILGERVVSGLMDRYLAKTNIGAQEAKQPIDPAERPDNLFAPPPGDPGAELTPAVADDAQGPADRRRHRRRRRARAQEDLIARSHR
jgi:NAD(P)-dependent dehydrogenase (short-subunit alcohol dehydrogenase family)